MQTCYYVVLQMVKKSVLMSATDISLLDTVNSFHHVVENLWPESPPFSVNMDPISDPYGSSASVTIPSISANAHNTKYTILSAKSESLSQNGLASEQQGIA